jgi:hypothetical protein
MQRLVHSLDKYELECWIGRIEDRGQWIHNCAQKPAFIREMLIKHHDRPVAWTDADSEIMKSPDLFNREGQVDAMVCEYEWRNGKRETLSGTIWFNIGPGSLYLVDQWLDIQRDNQNEMDQRTLAMAVQRTRDAGFKVGVLPVEYCFIFDHHRREHPTADPFIVHYQHSRVRRQEDKRR